MSLENALEEERLSVVKLLESVDKRPVPRHRASHSPGPRPLVINDAKYNNGGSHSAGNSRRPSTSMLLDPDVPPASSKPTRPGSVRTLSNDLVKKYNGDHLMPSKSPSTGRSKSETRASYMDMDPYAERHSRYNLAPSRSSDSYGLSPQTSRSRSNSRPRKDESRYRGAHRRLTASQLKKAEGALGDLYRSPSADAPRHSEAQDSTSDEEEEIGSTSDETESEDSVDEDSDSDLDGLNTKLVRPDRETKSLMAAMEEERKSVQSSKFRVKSLIDTAPPPGTIPPPSMSEYAAYKRRIIHPSTAFDNNMDDAEYASDTEELVEARRAASLPFKVSNVESIPGSTRIVRTISRGNCNDAITDPTKRPKTFVLGTDLSPEATHALEWTVGTVLRDTNVLYIVCAYEDELLSGPSSTVSHESQEEDRQAAMKQLTTHVEKLLKRTRLQVHVIIEVIHCKTPRHLIMTVIDHVKPTMVIIGSRGRSALKGVLLGSFSNYIVEHSSVPAMVARRKLQKTKHKDLNVRLANNLRSQGGLSSAKVD